MRLVLFSLLMGLSLRLTAQTPTTRYADYDPVADFYNDYWAVPLQSLALKGLGKFLTPKLSRGAAILDLGCGTGHITRSLQDSGYKMTGLDGSDGMLNYARRKVPGAEFLLEDFRTMRLPANKFDAAICMSDGFNHMMTVADLTAAFKNAYAGLKPGGILFFDMNLEERYQRGWRIQQGVSNDRYACFNRSSYEASTKTGTVEFTLFYPDPQDATVWRRTVTKLTQHCFTDAEIQAALKAAGFSQVEALDAAQQLGIPMDVGRMYYRAVK